MAKIETKWVINLRTEETEREVVKASRKGLVNTIADIARDAIKLSPVVTGNNRRSIMFEVGPGGAVAKKELEGAVYSTSGYGGYLETGTVKMAPQPYFKPALDMHVKELPENIKAVLS